MTPDAEEIVKRFLARRDCSIQMSWAARETLTDNKDATNWRDRGLLPFPPEKIGARYFTTPDGVITLGLMNELAWMIGPENASAAAAAIWRRLFAGDRAGVDIDALRDTLVYFRKPSGRSLGITDKPRFPDQCEDSWEQVSGFPMRETTAQDMAKQPVPNSTTVIIPVGQLVTMWAISIEHVLDARNG
ncbi:hypothetical protein [Roseovarius salinarum]|uniref:hypothetical protein n=1 Tax=Roseovarius salinarum TaxID=1981892 RepID=UPI000C34F55F|nr:hypothetical protein [Roseovarius salinarum]